MRSGTLALVPLLLLVACGGGSSTSSATSVATGAASSSSIQSAAGSLPDPCQLMAPADIQSIIGVDPGAGTSGRGVLSPTARNCAYSALVIQVDVASGYKDLKDSFEHDNKPLQAESGVGQEAFWESDSKTFVAHDAKATVQVQIMDAPGIHGDKLDLSKKIATALLARMG